MEAESIEVDAKMGQLVSLVNMVVVPPGADVKEVVAVKPRTSVSKWGKGIHLLQLDLEATFANEHQARPWEKLSKLDQLGKNRLSGLTADLQPDDGMLVFCGVRTQNLVDVHGHLKEASDDGPALKTCDSFLIYNQSVLNERISLRRRGSMTSHSCEPIVFGGKGKSPHTLPRQPLHQGDSHVNLFMGIARPHRRRQRQVEAHVKKEILSHIGDKVDLSSVDPKCQDRLQSRKRADRSYRKVHASLPLQWRGKLPSTYRIAWKAFGKLHSVTDYALGDGASLVASIEENVPMTAYLLNEVHRQWVLSGLMDNLKILIRKPAYPHLFQGEAIEDVAQHFGWQANVDSPAARSDEDVSSNDGLAGHADCEEEELDAAED